MLYLWGNCRSLSLCSPNLFYILLWPLVLSRPLRQLLWKKKGGGRCKYISIKICMFIAAAAIYFLFFIPPTPSLHLVPQQLFQSLGRRHRRNLFDPECFHSPPGVSCNLAAAASGVVKAECIELKVTGSHAGKAAVLHNGLSDSKM